MRTRELRAMSDQDLAERLREQREELFNLRFQDATGALENTTRLKHTKRAIARILTIQNERALGLEKR